MKKNYALVVLVLLTFFVISFLTNIIGPLIPEIIQSYQLSLTMVSFLPFAFFIAYGVMSIPAGILTEKYGEKTVMLIAFAISFAGALLFAVYPNYIMSIVSLFLIGAGMAMLQVVINPLLRTAGGEAEFSFFSILAQLFFGLASFISPLVYSYLVLHLNEDQGKSALLRLLSALVPENLPWVSLYWIFAVIAFLMVGIVMLFRFPKVILNEDEKPGALATHVQLLKNPTVILFFLGIFCYVGSEQGVANWMSEFLSAYHGYNPQTTGAHIVAWFWGMMTAGTFVGLFLVKLFDSRYIIISFTMAAIISLTAALFGSATVALYAFPAIGFFAAVMYPIIISLGLNSVEEHHGSFSGILITGICGGAVVPLIIGFIGDHINLRTGMLFLYISFGYILTIGIWAKPLISNLSEQKRKKQ
ncbi:MAG: sugar MFS transporter [Sphingobacteriia bacterium]|nr:sugar MFS transporter [Sphingobacteriia bacterium]